MKKIKINKDGFLESIYILMMPPLRLKWMMSFMKPSWAVKSAKIENKNMVSFIW